MRIINSNDIAEVVKGMCIKANCHINKDIKSALSNSVKTEKSDIAKGVIENLLKNAEIADRLPSSTVTSTGDTLSSDVVTLPIPKRPRSALPQLITLPSAVIVWVPSFFRPYTRVRIL